ncbi:KLTH0E14454p [Lachancea thermotolerans CBS 6340]|uniref:KLTH0E14454p n=1 Tax=Lachancea thermotolerans (strain ATCC 56472 / CBS 6340 / NRRL Y-8284) TaxID=559295 RepID=C5DIQ9_LACTC|nr:KLTH0E14454p [Lachancea thermotolerans CBS 6340]CAR23670.1 KLTH0E14454p [Lachancea thermotolerans CBS 6340]
MSDEALRKRVSKACDACRAKKIKCDGCDPCSNCKKVSQECGYTYVVKKRQKPPTRVSNRKILADLSQRLVRLEGILTQIRDGPLNLDDASIAESDSKFHAAPALAELRSANPLRRSSESDSAQSSELESELEPSDMDYEALPQSGSLGGYCGRHSEIDQGPSATLGSKLVNDSPVVTLPYTPVINSASDTTEVVQDSQLNTDGYLGLHSAFSIFKDSGIQWMRQKLNDNQELVRAVQQIKIIMCSDNFTNFGKFFEKTSVIDTYDFPPPETCRRLFITFLEHAAPVVPLDISSEILTLQEKFFVSPRTLNGAELFLIVAVLFVASTIQCQIACLKNDEISKWHMVQTQMVLKSLRLYQQTVLRFSADAVLYTKGVLVYCWLLENSPTPQLAYLALSTAIRLGQEVGLHLRESYFNTSGPSEALRRLVLWMNLYRYDVFLSIRTGKPALIHDGDTSSLNEWDFYQYMNAYCSGGKTALSKAAPDPDSHAWMRKLEDNLEIFASESLENLDFALTYYQWKLVQYSSKCYRYLLTCKAMVQSSFKRRLTLIKALNRDLEEWQAMLPPSLRPAGGISNLMQTLKQLETMPRRRGEAEPPWSFMDSTTASLRLKIINMHLEYYSSLLHTNCTLNRIPWCASPEPAPRDPDALAASEKCTYAARMMIKLGKLVMEPEEPNMVLRGIAFYCVFNGFLNMFWRCIEHPQSSKDDLLLLNSTCLSISAVAKVNKTEFGLKWATVAFLCLNFQKAAVETYEASCGSKDPELDLSVIRSEIESLHPILGQQAQGITVQLHVIDESRNNLRSAGEADARSERQLLNTWFSGLPGTNSGGIGVPAYGAGPGQGSTAAVLDTLEVPMVSQQAADVYGLQTGAKPEEESLLGSQVLDLGALFSAADSTTELPTFFYF